MVEICPKDECTGCEACATACPTQCISMMAECDGFYYPEIDPSKCIECHKCVKTCPNNYELKKGVSDFYMGWHRDKDVLLNSSSGGAFTAISQYVLRKNGIVYGAYFDEDTQRVEHISVEKEEQLYKLRLSKYFQSRINECYKNVEIELKKNRLVLFTGTACQIAGLYKFLNREYDNLITADVLCHGVTSKKVVDKYIDSKEKRYRKKIKRIRFRLKPSDSDWMQGGVPK